MRRRATRRTVVRVPEPGSVPVAFVAAPVVGSLVFAFLVAAANGPAYDAGAFLLYGFVAAMFGAVPTTVVFGVPAWLLLRGRTLDPFGSALVGLLVAVAPWSLVLALNGGLSHTAYEMMCAVGVSGVVSGLAFWKMTFGLPRSFMTGDRS